MLCTGKKSDTGFFIFVDAITSEVTLWDVESSNLYSQHASAEAFTELRRKLEELKVFPLPNKVRDVEYAPQEFKAAIWAFGWPPSQGDGSGRKRK